MILALFAVAAVSVPPDFSWMTGEWISCVKGEIVEEHWMGPARGTLLGANLTRTRDGRKISYEFLRIEPTPDGASYFALPKGIPLTEFKMTRHEGRKVVFENPDVPFPARILYWREGEKLPARTEGRIRGADAAEDWVWSRKSASNCLKSK